MRKGEASRLAQTQYVQTKCLCGVRPYHGGEPKVWMGGYTSSERRGRECACQQMKDGEVEGTWQSDSGSLTRAGARRSREGSQFQTQHRTGLTAACSLEGGDGAATGRCQTTDLMRLRRWRQWLGEAWCNGAPLN